MTGFLAFLNSPLGRKLAIAAGLALLLGLTHCAAYRAGIDHEKDAQAKRVETAKKHVKKVEGQGAAITDNLRGTLETQTAEIKTNTVTLIKKVPFYVTREIDRACPVPAGAVGLLNAAASGSEVPGPAGGSDQPASGVSLSAVIETGLENLGIGREWQAEALTWRSWYAQQDALWRKSFPKAYEASK